MMVSILTSSNFSSAKKASVIPMAMHDSGISCKATACLSLMLLLRSSWIRYLKVHCHISKASLTPLSLIVASVKSIRFDFQHTVWYVQYISSSILIIAEQVPVIYCLRATH